MQHGGGAIRNIILRAIIGNGLFLLYGDSLGLLGKLLMIVWEKTRDMCTFGCCLRRMTEVGELKRLKF